MHKAKSRSTSGRSTQMHRMRLAISRHVAEYRAQRAFEQFLATTCQQIDVDGAMHVCGQTRAHSGLVETTAHQRGSDRVEMVNEPASANVCPVDSAVKLLTTHLPIGQPLDSGAVFGGQSVPRSQPLRDIGLRFAESARESGLRANEFDGLQQRFAMGIVSVHGTDGK
jgi:hypothetical protein